MPDMVNQPPHYTQHPSGIEPIEITRHCNFNVGNAIKYLMRHDFKGKPIEDLEKAAWYIADEIKYRKERAKASVGVAASTELSVPPGTKCVVCSRPATRYVVVSDGSGNLEPVCGGCEPGEM